VSETRIIRRIAAPRAAVWRALLDAAAVERWMVPQGMRSRVELFEPWEGGRFRISLTYDTATGSGKTTAQTDTHAGRFLRLVPEREAVRVAAFETTDPAMQGWMTIAIRLADAPGGGTEVRAEHLGVPPGIAPADNETGWRMALDRLAALLEPRSA